MLIVTETFFHGGSASPCRERQKLNAGVVSLALPN